LIINTIWKAKALVISEKNLEIVERKSGKRGIRE
jgi:hypothetical protein